MSCKINSKQNKTISLKYEKRVSFSQEISNNKQRAVVVKQEM